MAKTRTQPKAEETVKVFDLTERFMAPTIEIVIKDTLVDRDRDTGVRITLKSPQSVEARDAARKARASFTTDGELTPAQVDDLFLEQLVACTVAWSGFTMDGDVLDCTPENVRAIYSNPACQWIYTQVMSAFVDTARFFAARRSS